MIRTLKRCCCVAVVALLTSTTLYAESITSEIPLKKGEHWWGVFLSGEQAMPLDAPFAQVDLSRPTQGNMRPLLLSSLGRYIWSDAPFKIAFNGTALQIDSDKRIEAVEAGKNLREAYLVAFHKNINTDITSPISTLKSRTIYDLSAEYGFQLSAEQVLEYVARLKENNLPVGTLLIPAGWQRSIGVYEPALERFPDIRALCEQLQGQGFRVMLTITPHVSADGELYRQYRKSNTFLRSEDRTLSMDEWEGGWSALYDLSLSESTQEISQRLDQLRAERGVGCFRFDAQGVTPYLDQAQGGAQSYLSAWSALGRTDEGDHYTLSQGVGFARYVRCWSLDEEFTWAQVARSLDELIQATLLGDSYCTLEARRTDFVELAQRDPEMFLRYAQLLTALPVMNLPCSPWSIEDAEVASRYRAILASRTRFDSYYNELIEQSTTTMEPLVRHLEYEFPKQGFNDCADQFMIGSKYLVAPLMSDEPYRTVRLPRGVWRDGSGKRFRGPIVISVPAPTDHVLYFERVMNMTLPLKK